MSSVVIAGNTSGTITLDAPAVAGTTTLTLPTTSGTVIADTATQTLTNKTLGAGTVMPTGTVLQVVQGTYSTQIALSSPAAGTQTATGLTASITPKSSSSKILIMTSNQAWFQNTATALYGHYTIFKNVSTSVFIGGTAEQVINTSEFGVRTNIIYLDSPATTSSTSYSVSFMNDVGTTNLVLNRNSAPAVIILMEIAG
jgi:hypothetical protein